MAQELIAGSASLSQIPLLLVERKAKFLLVVAGQHLLQESAFQSLTNALPVSYRLLHPPENLLQIDAVPRLEGVDAVLAIGGGKTIDFAKGIVHRLANPALLIAVPTTAGSGSEATPFAVFYSGTEKVSIDDPMLLPAVAVLDETLLQNLSPRQRALSGADAFAQCVESVWNVRSSPASEAFALEGLSVLWRRLQLFVSTQDLETTREILWAAHLSGKAIAQTRTTGPHALSYYLTAHHGVPHGQAVALFLPLFFLYNQQPQNAAVLEKLFSHIGVHSAQKAFQSCTDFFSGIGLATNFRQLDIAVDVDSLLRSVNQQRFANNPVPFDGVRLKHLIQQYLL